MDSSARQAPVDLETLNENGATDVSATGNETDTKGDAWIQKFSQPLLTEKKSTKTEAMRLGNHQRNKYQR